MLTIAQQVDLREACLEFLAVRYPNAYQSDAIRRMLVRRQRIDFEPELSDMTAALSFLKEEAMVAAPVDPLSPILAWSATSPGVTRYQRGLLKSNPQEGVL